MKRSTRSSKPAVTAAQAPEIDSSAESSVPNSQPESPEAPAKAPRKRRAPRKAAPKAELNPTREADDEMSRVVPAIPMRGLVAFPGMVMPLFIGREKSSLAAQAAFEGDKVVLLVAQRDEEVEDPGARDLHAVGTLATVSQLMKMPDGNLRVIIEGAERAHVAAIESDDPFLLARVSPVSEQQAPEDARTEALLRRLREGFEQVVNLSRTVPPEALHTAMSIEKPGDLADMVAGYIEIPLEARQQILEETDHAKRAQVVVDLLGHELQVLEIERELDSQVREGVSDSQREYFLRERMKAIQDKLGDRDSNQKDADTLRERVQAAGMPDEARDKAISEIERMERMPPIAPEVSIIRTYVEMLCDLPWTAKTEDRHDLNRAQEILDVEHFGLEKIKDRILEFLAVRKLNPDSKGPILCFMGPPGVGKTSIGKSIAHALGREFIRISVGGVHDEAEVRGHRRTYIGAMPGRIVAGMKRVKVKNPVFLLDEIDKIGRDFRGDPSSALLEALDPEQNSTFTDHYLEVPFDLSSVMWIATGNLLDPIPAALRDRLEVIRFPGYTDTEKLNIAKGFLLPKQIKENGLSEESVAFDDAAIDALIRDYTREAGVRNLEREIGSVCRKIAREVAALDDASTWEKKTVGAKDVSKYLGPRPFVRESHVDEDEVGVAQGLAWTEVGGEILPIEVSLVDGDGKVKLTGNLGNVMKESCEAAMTYARSHAESLGIDGDWTKRHDAHIHVPSGATPKDGPSAGVAISLALISAMTKRKVRADVAMTGEISLRGRVLPVGGVREKVLAAHRSGITNVLLPRENERDLEDLAAEVRSSMSFHLLDKVGEAVTLALQPIDKSDPLVQSDDETATDETLVEEKKPEKAPKKARAKKS